MLQALKATQERTHSREQSGLPEREPIERTTFVEIQHYLRFKYGANSVEITLPDNLTTKLVIGANGRAYFQFPISG